MFKKRIKKSGFSLIEAVIALIILGIAFGSVIFLSISSSQQLHKSADVLLAISLAQVIMEKSKSKSYDLIEDSEFQSFLDLKDSNLFKEFEVSENQIYSIDEKKSANLYKQLQSMKYQYKIEVEELQNTVNSKLIQVVVQWENKGNSLNFQLNGYISKRV